MDVLGQFPQPRGETGWTVQQPGTTAQKCGTFTEKHTWSS